MAHDSSTQRRIISTVSAGIFPTITVIGSAVPSASGTWPNTNLVYAIPFKLPYDYTAVKFFFVNGSAPGGNWNMGIFNSDCSQSLYVSGSVSAVGDTASTPHVITPGSAVTIPGNVELNLLITHDSTTANHACAEILTASKLYQLGVHEIAGAFSLTAPLTMADPATTLYPIAGFSRLSTPFL